MVCLFLSFVIVVVVVGWSGLALNLTQVVLRLQSSGLPRQACTTKPRTLASHLLLFLLFFFKSLSLKSKS